MGVCVVMPALYRPAPAFVTSRECKFISALKWSPLLTSKATLEDIVKAGAK